MTSHFRFRAICASHLLILAITGAFSWLTSPLSAEAAGRRPASIPSSCPDALVHYIPMTNQYFTAPTPIEDHSEEAFCFSHPLIGQTIEKLKTLRPVHSKPNDLLGRILIIPRQSPKDALILCQNGEITFRGKQYRLPRAHFEPALIQIRDLAEQALQKHRSSEIASDMYFD